MMKPIAAPKLLISFTVDLEVEYNSFDGKTEDGIADALQDSLHDALFELHNVIGVCSVCTSIDSANDEH